MPTKAEREAIEATWPEAARDEITELRKRLRAARDQIDEMQEEVDAAHANAVANIPQLTEALHMLHEQAHGTDVAWRFCLLEPCRNVAPDRANGPAPLTVGL